jgi:choline dehydrogenase-like flavoprotein
MIFPRGAATRTNHATACDVVYDVVVVGAGVSGAIMANELSRAGRRVLVL